MAIGLARPTIARRAPLLAALVIAPALAACGATPRAGAQREPAVPSARVDADSAEALPAGNGSLRQEDVALKIQLRATLVRILPLDESIIRLLSPDSYKALHELKRERQDSVSALAARYGVRDPSLWYVSFYGLEPEARFNAMEVVITSAGRDHRPLDVLPLNAGFGSQRVRQRETQSAIYLFDGGVDPNQPLVVTVDGVRNTAWEATLRDIERERSLVRSRAARQRRP